MSAGAFAVEFMPGERQNAIDGGWNPDDVAWLQPMSDEAVQYMVAQPVDGPEGMDGRSEWLWVRLPNGDLMCGFFPHGDSYFEHEAEREV